MDEGWMCDGCTRVVSDWLARDCCSSVGWPAAGFMQVYCIMFIRLVYDG